jgi:type I restriction enzyme S subunit
VSAVLEACEPSARYLDAVQPALVRQFDPLVGASAGVTRLRELILALAMQGKLLPQDPTDEPANKLVRRLVAQRGESTLRRRAATGTGRYPAGASDALPSSWETASLSAISVKLTDGSHNPPRDAGSGIPMLSSQNVLERGTIDFDSPTRYVSTDDFERENARTNATPGDVLLTIVASLGRSAVVPVDAPAFVLQRSVAVIRTGLVPSFLAMFLRSPAARAYYDEHGKGTAQKGIYLGKLGELTVPIPPLAEQSRIVARVDGVMRLCDALEAKGRLEAEQHARLLGTLLGTLTDSSTPEELAANWLRVAGHLDLLLDRPEAVDALEQTILQLAVRGLLVPQETADAPAEELRVDIERRRKSKRRITPPDSEAIAEAGIELPIGWSWCSIDQVSADDDTAITDGPFGANLKTEHYIETEGFRVIRLQNIGEGLFRDEHRAYIDEERFSRLRRHAILPGDIVVAGLVDESIRCCIVPEDVGPAIVKADCYRFAVHEKVSAEYICVYLCSETAHRFASAHHHGLTLTRIGLGNFRSIPVALPPAGEQRRVVVRVTALRRLCADLRGHLAAGQVNQYHLAQALVDDVV